jgi:hypothetical protein
MKTPQELREQKYADGIIRGKSKRQAALDAGFNKSTAEHSAGRIHNRPAVQEAIATARAELRAAAVYDTKAAVAEVDSTIEFARQHKNPMAAAKLLDLKCRLLGLLVEKVDLRISEKPDVLAALNEARRRVTVINPPPMLTDPSVINPLE